MAFDVPNKESGFMGICGKYTKDKYEDYFGEHNEENNLHGRGIIILPNCHIDIGFYNNSDYAPGNYIEIFSDGDVDVGEIYLKDGKRWNKCTRYFSDGKTKESD